MQVLFAFVLTSVMLCLEVQSRHKCSGRQELRYERYDTTVKDKDGYPRRRGTMVKDKVYPSFILVNHGSLRETLSDHWFGWHCGTLASIAGVEFERRPTSSYRTSEAKSSGKNLDYAAKEAGETHLESEIPSATIC